MLSLASWLFWFDGGQKFESGNFHTFCAAQRINHCLSSAHYLQSNSQAEAAVKKVKALLWHVSEESAGLRRSLYARFLTGLMEVWATPLKDGLSPSE